MKQILNKISKHKNNKFFYFSLNFARQFVPRIYFRALLYSKLPTLKKHNISSILERVNYYNKLNEFHCIPVERQILADFRLKKKLESYFFDTFEYTQYFSDRMKLDYSFSDICTAPPIPAIVKNRPIGDKNTYGLLLNLDNKKYYKAITDNNPYEEKKNMLVGRMQIQHSLRLQFMDRYFDHHLCDVGLVHKKACDNKYLKNNLSVDEQLKYKFILCVEGNDADLPLSWIMNSNSVAVMPRPKFETWFMEGKLVPNVHYIEIMNDYSDLEQKLKHYIEHPQEAIAIIQNAKAYVAQFKNKKQENLISLLVLEKYCFFTGQKELNKHCRGFFSSGK